MTDHQTTLNILKRARILLTPPGAWTRRAFARGRDGELTTIGSETAVSWCSVGALEASAWGEDRWSAQNHLMSATNIYGESLLMWNDNPGRTQEEVLAAFDKAIATPLHD